MAAVRLTIGLVLAGITIFASIGSLVVDGDVWTERRRRRTIEALRDNHGVGRRVAEQFLAPRESVAC